jgi:Fic family protein
MVVKLLILEKLGVIMKIPQKVPVMPKDFIYGEVLEQLRQQGRFSAFFQANESRYYYYDKWRYLAKDWNFDPKMLWAAVKSTRAGNRRLSISDVRGFDFQIGSPSIVQEYLHKFDMELGGSLLGDGIIPATERDRYLISSLMEEAIASSQLEGAATTRRVAKEMLESNRKPKNASEQMILNNYEAMKWIVANKSEPFSIETIQQLHSILTASTLPVDEEGAFRKTDDINVVDVQSGEIIYRPPASEYIDLLMKDFCLFANDQNKNDFFIHPVTKGIILHFLIGYIHPFSDGNGRTARTIFYWYLIKHGYWLIEYMSVSRIILNSKAQYARAYLYTEQDDNDLTYFLIYNLRSIHLALVGLKSYIKRKSSEKQNAMTLLRNTDLNERQILLIQEVIQHPLVYFTVVQMENKFGVSNQTGRNDLKGLVEKGFFETRRNGHHIQFLPVKDFARKISE